AAVFGGGTCTGAALNPGASCTVGVTFTPAGDGPLAGTLSIGYSDGASAQVAVRALAATATSKALLNIYDWTDQYGQPNSPGPSNQGANVPPFDYGVWGVPIDHTFTIRNDGGGPATMMASAGALGTGFSWKNVNYPGMGGDCGTGLAVGA